YAVAVSALPPGTTGDVDAATLSLTPGGAGNLVLTIHPPAISDELLAPDVTVSGDGYLPPGAEPLVTATEDGGADAMTLLYPDGTAVPMTRQPDGSFTARYLVALDAQDVAMARVRATRGNQTAEGSAPIPIVAGPLATVEFSPAVPRAGTDVAVTVTALFVPDNLRLDGDRVSLDLTRDPQDPTVWRGVFHLPPDANGRTEFTVSGQSARVKLNLPVILVVRAGP
ncbi:MAG TPA: hypothetical protein VHN99_11650, partial [Deinococcales bacterium]|nr:hypothetical protein [Deinococcales bacterium]